MGTEPEDLPGPEVDLGFTACNLNMQLELQIHDSFSPDWPQTLACNDSIDQIK